MRTIRISASRLKLLTDCTVKFYYQEILRLPDGSHWKTRTGSVVHLLFECIMNQKRPKRVALFMQIMVTGRFNLSDHPELLRFIKWQLQREEIADRATPEDINELINVAWLGIRPHFTSVVDGEIVYTPPPHFVNEQRFEITLSSGAVISGFIDLLLVWPDRAIVIDLKTQKDKFTRKELPNNIQAIMYQLVCHRQEGFMPAVEFIMLRHAPTKRTPNLHIQRVEAPPDVALEGLEYYVDQTYARVNTFGLEDALVSPCDNLGFCLNVCKHYAPHPYWIVSKADDPQGLTPLSSHLELDKATKACKDGEITIERQHAGCMVAWRG